MNRNLPLTEIKLVGQAISFNPFKAAQEASRLSKVTGMITVYWTNDTKSPDRPYFAATGRVVGFAVDGEGRDCIVMNQFDAPGYRILPRVVVATDIIVIEAPQSPPAETPRGRG